MLRSALQNFPITTAISICQNKEARNLTNRLENPGAVDKLTAEYQKHKDQNLYQSVMDIIIRANKEKFEEARNMCEALRALFADELEEKLEEKLQEQREQLEDRINNLNIKLLQSGRIDDVMKASSDKDYQKRLFEEFGL